MIKLNLCSAVCSITLLASLTINYAHSTEPMSENDMSGVSAESGDVLNIMGATASGEYNTENTKTTDGQLQTSNQHSQTSGSYLESEQPREQNPNASETPSSIDARETVSTFKMREVTDGQIGSSTIYYDEKEHNLSSSIQDGSLVITQDVRVQRVHISEPRHSPSSIPQGDRYISDMSVTGSTTIIER